MPVEKWIRALTNFSEFYIKIDEMKKSIWVLDEMENLDDEYRSAYETAREYLNSLSDDRSSVASDILSVDILQRMNIADDWGTYREDDTMLSQQRFFPTPRGNEKTGSLSDHTPTTTTKNVHFTRITKQVALILNTNMQRHGYIKNRDFENRNVNTTEQSMQDQSWYRQLLTDSSIKWPAEKTTLPSIGQDLWKLKRIKIPVFSGDKRLFQS